MRPADTLVNRIREVEAEGCAACGCCLAVCPDPDTFHGAVRAAAAEHLAAPTALGVTGSVVGTKIVEPTTLKRDWLRCYLTTPYEATRRGA